MTSRLRKVVLGVLAAALVGVVPAAAPAWPQPASAGVPALGPDIKQPVAEGYGGVVSTVDLDAGAAGLAVLRRGEVMTKAVLPTVTDDSTTGGRILGGSSVAEPL